MICLKKVMLNDFMDFRTNDATTLLAEKNIVYKNRLSKGEATDVNVKFKRILFVV